MFINIHLWMCRLISRFINLCETSTERWTNWEHWPFDWWSYCIWCDLQHHEKTKTLNKCLMFELWPFWVGLWVGLKTTTDVRTFHYQLHWSTVCYKINQDVLENEMTSSDDQFSVCIDDQSMMKTFFFFQLFAWKVEHGDETAETREERGRKIYVRKLRPPHPPNKALSVKVRTLCGQNIIKYRFRGRKFIQTKPSEESREHYSSSSRDLEFVV